MNFLDYPFMRTALVVSLLAGNAVAMVGLFVLVRRTAFSGLAVAQLAALGGVIGILVGHHSSFGAAIVLVVAGLGLLSRLARGRVVPQEAWVAALYIGAAALAVLILAKAPMGEAHTMSVFFGNVLTLGRLEVLEAAGLFAVAIPALTLWRARWMWLSFDAPSAEVAGVRLGRWNLFFYALFAVAMTFAIHFFGVLLAFAYLVLPATSALLVAGGTRSLFIAVPSITTAATLLGFAMSFRFDWPTGPFISALLALVVALSALIRATRGRRAR